MPKRQSTIKKCLKIKKRYNEVSIKHPQWRHGAIMQFVASEFFLEEGTVSAILRGSGIYQLSA